MLLKVTCVIMGDKRCNAFATFYSTNCAIDYVDDDIVMMYVVYVHGDAMTKLDIPDGENRVVKEF